ncbi:TonB-dependent receptor [Fluviicola taffensis]|uniref:TonB-dependent receptor n=1 Tax=Fluviicola taffensis TaxID=191579 RepID=UPI003137DFB8
MQAQTLKKHLLLFFLLVGSTPLVAQREFTFNSDGNACHFNYVCYAPNNNYTNVRRPFIFLLGDEYEDPQDLFVVDSIKDLPQFYNYLFVYVPNRDGNSFDKLKCLESLGSLITFGFTYGHSNVFLRVQDPAIRQADIDALGLNTTFKSVQLFERTNTLSPNAEITENFTEDKEAYGVVKTDEGDKYGTFYVEEEKKDEMVILQKAKKTYFGPPSETDFTLSGIIKDRSTGEALPFATIQIKNTSRGGSSNADGYFTIRQIPTDTSTLIVTYVGYEKTELFLSPVIDKKHFVIELLPTTQELQNVTITGVRQDVVLSNKEDVSVIKMTPKKLEQLPNLGERDVMRSFQLMPGVSASNESSSGLYVRGGTPDQNLVLYDGFTVYHVDHLYGFFSAFNSNALKDVQLFKGGFESRFGGRLSSVTEITGKEGNQKKFNLGGDFSLLSMNVFVEIPVGTKFSSVIAFRRSYKGPIYDKIFEKFNKSSSSSSSEQSATGGGPGGNRMQETKVTSFFYDLNGKFTYKPTTKDIISLSIFNGTDKLDNSSSFDAPSFGSSNSNFSMSSTDLTKYGNIGSSLKWSRKWSEKLYGNTVVSYSNYYSDRDRSQERTTTNSSGEETTTSSGIFENNDLKDYSFKSDYEWNLFNFSQLQFGVFGTYFDIDYTYAENDTTTVLDKHNKAFLGGTYLQNKFKFWKERIQFVPGIRASYFETTKQFYYEPRATITVSLTDKLTLKGATGKYYQFANRVTREDILSGSKDFWLLSDGNTVPVSSAIHYIGGLSYETPNYLFSTEAYYKQISDITEYSLRFNASPGGVSYDENFFTGSGYSKGMEFLVQKKSGKLNGWVSYTLGQARNKFDVYSDSYYSANQDVTHEFKAVLLYKYKRWDFSVTWIYATGRPYTAPSGAYTVSLLDGSTQDFFTVTSKNGLRLPDYHRCDIAVNYKLLGGTKGDKKRREIGYVGFSVFNLYNRINTWYKQYSIEDGEVIETNVNYLGFTPNVTLSLKLR